LSLSDFELAYDEHAWRIFGFFAYRVGSRADAEDLTQQTFERALRAWERYDERRASMASWLLAIARNLMIDHYRASSLRDHVPLDEVGEGSLPQVPGPELRLGIGPELALALAQLSDREREILALRFGGDLAGPEIAEVVGLSYVNVQQITSRALRRMRAVLEETRPAVAVADPGRSERQRANVRHAKRRQPQQ
jgi:RNA polymerase sigma-70 factor (ECF subfamily)